MENYELDKVVELKLDGWEFADYVRYQGSFYLTLRHNERTELTTTEIRDLNNITIVDKLFGIGLNEL